MLYYCLFTRECVTNFKVLEHMIVFGKALVVPILIYDENAIFEQDNR